MSNAATPPAPAPTRTAVSWRSVIIFCAVAYALLALAAAPFWFLAGGIEHPLFSLVIAGGMFAPTIASVVVAKLVDRTSWRDAVGLRFRGRWKRIGIWVPLSVVVVFTINLATAVILVLRGVPGDLTGGTWARLTTESYAEAGAPLSTPAAVALTLLVALIGVAITTVPALGEEIGWRELKPLGLVATVLISGTIWSLWHLPVNLIGYNYPGAPRAAAIAMFIPACIAMTYLFGAITERAGGNPLPATVAHATSNSTMGLALGLVSTTETMSGLNWFIDTPLGVTGIAVLAIAGFLIMPRRRGAPTPPPPDSARTTATDDPSHEEVPVAPTG